MLRLRPYARQGDKRRVGSRQDTTRSDRKTARRWQQTFDSPHVSPSDQSRREGPIRLIFARREFIFAAVPQ
ncbi:hypothetical protein BRAS3843_960009 [Bradyrhizobium sp. STM 3843]|nr:hypothetical protein BRAS3843_960009 [Bradyrhizobium sp. STM 3843]